MNREVDINEIDGKDYFLMDEIETIKTTYYFYVGVTDSNDIQVLKKVMEDNEEYYQSLDSEKELLEAFNLFYEKHQND